MWFIHRSPVAGKPIVCPKDSRISQANRAVRDSKFGQCFHREAGKRGFIVIVINDD